MDSGFRALRGPGMTVTASCTVSRPAWRFLGVAFAMFERRRVRRRRKAWIDVAEAAIAGDHVRSAFFRGAKFAIPHHVAGAEILHCAHGALPKLPAWAAQTLKASPAAANISPVFMASV
jgi:hypothetical protein